MRQVDVDTFEGALARGERAYDTRTEAAFRRDGIAGVGFLDPDAVQRGELPDVPREEPVYLICERGGVSELVGLYLEAAGFRDVANVAGGMQAWRRRAAGTRP